MVVQMKCSDYIAEFLAGRSIDTLFGYLGGYNADIIDSFCKKTSNRFVLNYHEQAAAFAINAIATVTGKTAVVTSSGAPSTCNLVAGVANAYFDSHPCVFLVGSVHSLALRKTKTIRQNGFEEIDFVHMVSDITKYAVRLQKPEDIRYELEKAFFIAENGRKGPVVVDIPYDMARTEIDPENLRSFELPEPEIYSQVDYQQIIELLQQARRPVLMLGGGTGSEACRTLIPEFLKKVKIPTVATMCGLDVLSHDHPCFAGFIGHYGNRYANLAASNCDLLLVLGARLEERQLGGYLTKLPPGAKLIRVEIDKNELKRKLPETVSIHSSTEQFLRGFLKEEVLLDFSRWIEVIAGWKKRYPAFAPGSEVLTPNLVVSTLTSLLPEDGVVSADVGQNQMSVAQGAYLDGNKRILNSAGYASMGYSLPAAVGAAFARPHTRVISFSGDGGIQMNIQELQTIVRENLNVAVVVLNNHCLGMIRRLQEKMYDNRTFVSVSGYSTPDFGAVAKAYGIRYLRIETVAELQKLKDFLSPSGPCFIEVMFPTEMENDPEPGAVIDKQTPLLTDEEMAMIQKECKTL